MSVETLELGGALLHLRVEVRDVRLDAVLELAEALDELVYLVVPRACRTRERKRRRERPRPQLRGEARELAQRLLELEAPEDRDQRGERGGR